MSGLSKKNIETSLKFVYSDNNSLSVIFHDNDLLMGVVGEFNKNLKELEKITNSNLYSRGNSILIKSTTDKNEMVLAEPASDVSKLQVNEIIQQIRSSRQKEKFERLFDGDIQGYASASEADLALCSIL